MGEVPVNRDPWGFAALHLPHDHHPHVRGGGGGGIPLCQSRRSLKIFSLVKCTIFQLSFIFPGAETVAFDQYNDNKREVSI